NRLSPNRSFARGTKFSQPPIPGTGFNSGAGFVSTGRSEWRGGGEHLCLWFLFLGLAGAGLSPGAAAAAPAAPAAGPAAAAGWGGGGAGPGAAYFGPSPFCY